MMALDLYLSNLSKKENSQIDLQTSYDNSNFMPLLSWDIYSDGYQETLQTIKRATDIQQIMDFAEKFKWQNSVESLFKNETFEAIVLTDLHQNIVWVNNGFTAMTGYSKKDALNKRPHFLQGPKTSDSAKQRIRKKLTGIEPFTEIITNYKKNRDSYDCEVKIFPLYAEETTHYMALEKRVV